MPNYTKQYLEVGEVASILNLSPATVRRLFDEGALHGFRIPGGEHRRISTQSVHDFAESVNLPIEAPPQEAQYG